MPNLSFGDSRIILSLIVVIILALTGLTDLNAKSVFSETSPRSGLEQLEGR